jgi:HSP20 family protein
MTTLARRSRWTLPDLIWSGWPMEGLETWVEGTRPMRIEEFMDGDTLVVRAEAPGLNPAKDLEITVADGMLTIAAERHEEVTEGEKGKAGYRSEFHYGSLRRTVALPVGASASDITASYEQGVLQVRVPIVAATAAPHKVPIATAKK